MTSEQKEKEHCKDVISCNCTTEEVAKSFIEDVESVKDQLDGQPCDDCISRKAVMFEIGESYNIVDLEKRIKDLPSVQPTRPKGKWIILDECANEGVYCSECHKKVFKLEFSHTMKWRNFKYCPNCGADMRESEDKE